MTSEAPKQFNPLWNSCSNMLKLLVSERCNKKCGFCRGPAEIKKELTLDEIRNILQVFYNAGMTRVKLCGGAYGEPLLRADIKDIISEAQSIGFSEIGLATNGQLLTKKLVIDYANFGLTWLTHSISTLNKEKYRQFYGVDLKDSSLEAIEASSHLQRYNINVPLIRFHNDNEIPHLVSFAHERGAVLHIMELIGHQDNRKFYDEHYISADAVMAWLYNQSYRYVDYKIAMNHSYYINSGLVTLKQTTKSQTACEYCRRIFVSSEGKCWFCLPENVIADFRKESVDSNSLKLAIENRYNKISDKGRAYRLSAGCDKAVDGDGQPVEPPDM